MSPTQMVVKNETPNAAYSAQVRCGERVKARYCPMVEK
jgi:hypothetical protein